MIPFCRAEGIAIVRLESTGARFCRGEPSSPGLRRDSRAKTDDYAHQLYYQDSDFQTVDRITEVARQQGVSNAQIALAWLLGQPGVTAPIICRQQAWTIG